MYTHTSDHVTGIFHNWFHNSCCVDPIGFARQSKMCSILSPNLVCLTALPPGYWTGPSKWTCHQPVLLSATGYWPSSPLTTKRLVIPNLHGKTLQGHCYFLGRDFSAHRLCAIWTSAEQRWSKLHYTEDCMHGKRLCGYDIDFYNRCFEGTSAAGYLFENKYLWPWWLELKQGRNYFYDGIMVKVFWA